MAIEHIKVARRSNEWERLNKNLVNHLIERRKSYEKLTKHQRYYGGQIIFRDRKILNILHRYPHLLGTVKQHLIKKNTVDKHFLNTIQEMIRTSRKHLRGKLSKNTIKKKTIKEFKKSSESQN